MNPSDSEKKRFPQPPEGYGPGNYGIWNQFRESGMLWFTNRLLHIFGWAIVVSVDDAGSIIDAYPARVRFRGFSEKIEANGFEKVSAFLNQESQNLLDESRDDRTDC